MTLAKTGSEVLTKEEWNELIALELMVRSLEGKESNTPQ